MICSFCLLPGTAERRLVGGPGVDICGDCARLALDVLEASRELAAAGRAEPPWASWSDEELLEHLPEAAAVADQVERRLTDWVGIARSRKISWQRIGTALGMTRQSAWERFRSAEQRA